MWALFFLFSFFDPCSGLELEVPEAFHHVSEDAYEDHCWYTYEDSKGNELIIEIEENEYQKSHSEHFHHTLTKGTDEKEQMIYKSLEFKSFFLGPLEISKCQIRILAIAETYRQPLCLCDYLFVKDHYSYTISLIKEDDGVDSDVLMWPLLESISFKNPCPKTESSSE